MSLLLIPILLVAASCTTDYVEERSKEEVITFAEGSGYSVYGFITPNLNNNCGSDFIDNQDIQSLTITVCFELPEKSRVVINKCQIKVLKFDGGDSPIDICENYKQDSLSLYLSENHLKKYIFTKMVETRQSKRYNLEVSLEFTVNGSLVKVENTYILKRIKKEVHWKLC